MRMMRKTRKFEIQIYIRKTFKINPIEEEHGIIDIEYITENAEMYFKNMMNFCYLFGSLR